MATGQTFAGGTLRSVIPEVISELEVIARELVESTLVGIEARAAATAPIGPTGLLANSISHESRGFPGGAEGEARSGAEYSAYVNYGTGAAGAGSPVPNRAEDVLYTAGWKGMAARPYMSQASIDGEAEWNEAWRLLEPQLPHL